MVVARWFYGIRLIYSSVNKLRNFTPSCRLCFLFSFSYIIHFPFFARMHFVRLLFQQALPQAERVQGFLSKCLRPLMERTSSEDYELVLKTFNFRVGLVFKRATHWLSRFSGQQLLMNGLLMVNSIADCPFTRPFCVQLAVLGLQICISPQAARQLHLLNTGCLQQLTGRKLIAVIGNGLS